MFFSSARTLTTTTQEYFVQVPCLCYLNYVQFWQQVAVCKSEIVSVEEASGGELLLLHAVCVDLVGQGVVQVVVQLTQGSGQTFLQP